MIPIARPDARPDMDALLDGPGLATWFFQLVDELGNGVHLTWGFGHPEARQGKRDAAQNHPSFSLAIFNRAQKQTHVSLALHARLDPSDVVWDGPRWMFAQSRERSGDSQSLQVEALRDLKAQVMIARFDLELPKGERLTGHIEMGGVPRRGRDDEDELGLAPLTGYAEGRALLEVKPNQSAGFLRKMALRIPDALTPRNPTAARHFHLAGRAALHRALLTEPVEALEVTPFPIGNEACWVIGERQLVVDTEGHTREDAQAALERQETFSLRGSSTLREVSARTPMRIPARAVTDAVDPARAEPAFIYDLKQPARDAAKHHGLL